MTLRTRFFAMTYDRQMARTEKAGLGAFRERLLVGAAGSGKTSLAGRLFPAEALLSSDALRQQVSGDAANQQASPEAFRILHTQAARRLAAGRLTVVDATNIAAAARRPLRRMAGAHGRPAIAIVLDLAGGVCLARNAGRPGRTVPEAVVLRQLASLRRATFRQLSSDCADTYEVVARFLAVLELYRSGSVSFDQLAPLGELYVTWAAAQEGEG